MPLLYTTETQTDDAYNFFDVYEEREELHLEVDSLRKQLTQQRREDRMSRERMDELTLRLSVYEDEKRRLEEGHKAKDASIKELI